MLKRLERLRLGVQAAFALLTNSFFTGWVNGVIYQGSLKSVCVPGLNCYSCPGAWGACPLGSLQAVLSGRVHSFPVYVAGFLITAGAALGRFICGWLCPFGLLQDLIFRIPFFKKLKKLPGDRYLKYLKYVLLILFVIALPLFALDAYGVGAPWFCKYICPSGSVAGAFLVSVNEGLAAAAGWLFVWKLLLLTAIVLLSLAVYRPFCRYICPLGAIYGFFNPVSLLRLRLDKSACISCGACQNVCKLDIKPYCTPNSSECIRCGACTRACPTTALKLGFTSKQSNIPM